MEKRATSEPEIQPSLGFLVVMAMRQRGFNQVTAAWATGIPQSLISAMIGSVQPREYTLNTLTRLSNGLGIERNALITAASHAPTEADINAELQFYLRLIGNSDYHTKMKVVSALKRIIEARR